MFRTVSLAAGLVAASIAAVQAGSLDLKILHINDHHSHLRADARASLILDGAPTRVVSGGFPRVVTTIERLAQGRDNVVKLHAGDAITGDLYYTLFKGAADAALMNQVCFDAFALGNHEFDAGDRGLVDFLDHLEAGPCTTPVLSANVVPQVGTPLAPRFVNDYIRPYVFKTVRGERIALIGLTIAEKTKKASSPLETTRFLDEMATAQKTIDEVEAQGVDKIVLVTHIQHRNDLRLAAELDGVDVIVGGDSHTLLGDFRDVGLNPQGEYPTVVPGRGGTQVCVAQAWQYAQVVGELNVSFDADGKVIGCHGTPHMMLANSFKRRDGSGERVELQGEARIKAMIDLGRKPELSIVAPDREAAAVLAGFSQRVDALKAEVIGTVAEPLCLERIPGQGRSRICDVSDTAQRGSDISNLVAHAFRSMSKTSDIAIQNGGGVRVDIPAGDITVGDAYVLLPFANTLVELEMTGAEIHAVLEDALDFAIEDGGSTGAYPYAAGLRWAVDLSRPMGRRIANMEYKGRTDTAWVPLDRARTYTVVTNDFIAGGRDGYAAFKPVVEDGRATDTYLDYAQSFVEYVRAVGTLTKLPASEYSTQSFAR